ncbi:hypothetical protein XarbCFBP8138_17200 [Xanthomonas arboricola]|nr:hypothetical protein XarbCFBP8138_17200 [Xanthomonas arboricola]
MPRKSLHGRTCGVSREGGRARAPQPTHKPANQPLCSAITPTRAPAPAARRSPPAPACAPPRH